MATPPLHASVGILLSRALPSWAAIPACLFYHAVMDFYPEYGVPENILPISAMLSPHGSDTITWASGRYTAKGRNGTARTAARGIEVISTSSGGNLKIHLLNDYDSAGRIIWLVYPIPASGGFIQRIGFIFDMIDSAGTTITKTDIIIWY